MTDNSYWVLFFYYKGESKLLELTWHRQWQVLRFLLYNYVNFPLSIMVWSKEPWIIWKTKGQWFFSLVCEPIGISKVLLEGQQGQNSFQNNMRLLFVHFFVLTFIGDDEYICEPLAQISSVAQNAASTHFCANTGRKEKTAGFISESPWWGNARSSGEDTSIPYWSAWVCFPVLLPTPASCQRTLWEAAGSISIIWMTATHVGELN